MAKPTIIISGTYPPATTATIEDLRTDLNTLAAKFDGAIVDSDISSISYSKLSLTGTIKNADVSASAAIAGTKIADSGIDTLQLAANGVTFAKIVAGAVTKLQSQVGTVGITAGTNATDTTLATISITGPEAGTKFIAYGYGRFLRTGGTGEVILGVNIDAVDFTPRPTVGLDGNATLSTGHVIAHGTVGTSAIDVKLVAKGDGSLSFSHTSGEAYLIVLMLKRAD